MSRLRLLSRLLRGLPWALALVASGALAQGAYPNRPITLIAPYSVGGDADLAARAFAAAAQRVLGQPVLVQNKVGASGIIGSAQALAAPPDGYTLLLGRPGSQSILPAIVPATTKYKWDDFSIVGLLELNPYGCMVNAKSPYRNFEEFARALRERGKSMNFGTAGQLTTNDMGPRQLFKSLGLTDQTPTQVPYKGTGEATTSLMTGETDFACGSIGTFFALIKNGSLRALLVTTPERMASLPDVPTARELGFPDMERIVGWSGIYGPPGLPADVVGRLAQALKAIGEDASWRRATEQMGSIPRVLPPDETREFARAQYQIYRALGESLNLIDKPM
jgi:tripartite-type tricarboxylate transporter receptor subunit TctC